MGRETAVVAEDGTHTIDGFFAGRDASRALFDAVRAVVESLGPAEVVATKSQIAFRCDKPFAWTWMPAQYLGHGAPLVLSVVLTRRDPSPRWKQVVEPSPNRFMHHLELSSAEQLDDQVVAWLAEARRTVVGDDGRQADV